MACIVCDITALQVLRSIGVSGALEYGNVSPLEAKLPTRLVLESARCTGAELVRLDGLVRMGVCTPPYHVLVGPANRVSSRGDLICHEWSGPYTDGAFLVVSDGLYVCAPALCLAQLAGRSTRVSDGSLLKLAYEFCGSYTPDRSASTGTVERPPLATPALLGDRAWQLGRYRGAARVRSLAAHVLPGSKSPMESCQSILLNLPCSRGGYGLRACGPTLNPRIDLAVRSRLTGRSYYMPDLLYPKAKLAIEYKGRHHLDPRSAEIDERRRNEFTALGYEVVTVTWEQLVDDGTFDAIARAIARKLGHRIRPRDAARFVARRLSLRRELFGRAK